MIVSIYVSVIPLLSSCSCPLWAEDLHSVWGCWCCNHLCSCGLYFGERC